MSMDYTFQPNASRARLIDRNMRRSFAESLKYIAAEISGKIDFNTQKLSSQILSLPEGENFSPSSFGLYSELVSSLMSEKFSDAKVILELLSRDCFVGDQWEIFALDDPQVHLHQSLYSRLMAGDDSTSNFLPPSEIIGHEFRQRLLNSYAMMVSITPELAGEFDALVKQVFMVVGDPEDQYQFDGGSSYMLWGGLFLNASSHQNPVALIEVLAHESAHLLLFGFASEEALIKNGDDQLYDSPLRAEPRPMDGIFHATYVSARMHWAMSQLMQSKQLDEFNYAYAESARLTDQQNFESGYEVVARYGELTATGAAVMGSAREYMDGV